MFLLRNNAIYLLAAYLSEPELVEGTSPLPTLSEPIKISAVYSS